MSRPLAATPSTVYNAREGEKFNASTTLEVVECATCGITYAIPESLVSSARKYHGDTHDGWKLCCPLGHTWWYVGETALERERRLRRYEQERSGRIAADRDQARAEARAQKAAKTRIKNSRERERQRIANGVCPVCKRHFANVERHMRGQHPDHAHHGEPS